MSNLYNLLPDTKGYHFTSDAGDVYYAYFTEFTLQTKDGRTIETISFGFECKRADPVKRQTYDSKVKNTIIHIILDYFDKYGDEALLYLCLNIDGKARHRNIIFNRWFRELGEGFEQHKSKIETNKLDFYSSLLVKSKNPLKNSLIQAFHFTIDFWFPEE